MIWQWESFAELMEHGVTVADAGPLPAPVTSFTLRREPNRELVLETVTPGRAWGVQDAGEPGRIYTPDGVVRFTSKFGLVGEATGVWPGSSKSRAGPDGQRQLRQSAHLNRLSLRIERRRKVGFTLDWVENLDGESMIWAGGAVLDEFGREPTRKIGAGPTAVTLRGLPTGSSSRLAALELNVGGIGLFVCTADAREGLVRPGYFLYRGAPDDETRRRIREVVGFALGCGLVYLGSTGLTAKSELVWTTAVSGNPYGDRIFDFFAEPPAPLSANPDRWVQEAILSRCADALFRHYDEMNFRQLSWNYWHAVCAPMHMKPAHFGAAIEGLQDAYAASHPKPTRKRIIADGRNAKGLLASLKATLARADLDPKVVEILEGKIANLNQASGALVSERIFEELDLGRGPEEVAAWQRRNEAAHGKTRTPEESIPLMRDTKLLQLLLHRVVLRIADASPQYMDNYTVGRSVRPLRYPVGGASAVPAVEAADVADRESGASG